jgi:hypothetical protein
LAVSAGIDDEEIEMEFGGDVVEEGSVSQVGAESHPSREESGSVGLCCRHDATLGRFRRRHEFRAECMAVGSWHMRQGLSCGNLVLNRVSNWSSDMCMLLDTVSDIVLASPLLDVGDLVEVAVVAPVDAL